MTAPEDFRAAMRRLAAGVCLITTRAADGSPHGMAASSVVSVTAEPPVLLVCVNRRASLHAQIGASGHFCVNILGESHASLSRRFSRPEERPLRFADPVWTTLATGAPALTDALAALDCRLAERVETATHSIFLGEVVALRLGAQPALPLAWFDGGFRSLAAAAHDG